MELLTANFENVDELSALASQTFHDTYVNKMSPKDLAIYISEAFNSEVMLAELLDASNVFILVRECGKAIAYMKLSKNKVPERLEPDSCILIDRLYVASEYQGKGIGSLLLDECYYIALKDRISAIWLAVWKRNTKAIKFYRQYNFEIFSEATYLRGNDRQHAFHMRRIVT